MNTEYEIVQDIYQDLTDFDRQDKHNEARRRNFAIARAVQHQKAQERGYDTRKAPFGFTFEDNEMVENPSEQAVLCQMRMLRNRGLSYGKIANSITQQGYVSRTGKPYNSGHVHLLLNPTKRMVA